MGRMGLETTSCHHWVIMEEAWRSIPFVETSDDLRKWWCLLFGRILHTYHSKVLRLARKTEARSHEALHLWHKIILENLKIRCSEMQPFSGNQRLDLGISLIEMSLVLPLQRESHLCRSTPAMIFETATKPSSFCLFWQCADSVAPRKNHNDTSKNGVNMRCFLCFDRFDFGTCFARQLGPLSHPLPNMVRTYGVFTVRIASRHSRTNSFHISASNSAPPMRCFWDFDLENAPSRHNSVHFLNISTTKNAPRVNYFFAFRLLKVLRATAARNFTSLLRPDGSAPGASATLRTSGATKTLINIVFRTCLPFSALISFLPDSLFSAFFSSLILFLLSLSLSLSLSVTPSHLWLLTQFCCLCPYVGSLASKLPSTNISNTMIFTYPYHAISNAPFYRCLLSMVQSISMIFTKQGWRLHMDTGQDWWRIWLLSSGICLERSSDCLHNETTSATKTKNHPKTIFSSSDHPETLFWHSFWHTIWKYTIYLA